MPDADRTATFALLRHPLRRQILRKVRDTPDISPKEVAMALGEPLSNCSYHCRVLREAGAIELVGQKPVRGAIQNHYRLAIDEPWVLELLANEDAP